MGFIELMLIATGLSMDASAVALCKGLKMRWLNYKHAFIVAVFFGGFQAAMPLIGWLLGKQFEKYIVSVDHWIALILLSYIGIKMIRESYRKDDSCCISCETVLDIKELVMLSIATSLDALAVGITFAFLRVSILPSIALIGIITFVLSFISVAVGNRFGIKFKSKAEFVGGIILIAIGLKILLEHLEIL